MAHWENRHLPLAPYPKPHVQGNSVFRSHDDVTGMPIPEGAAVTDRHGLTVDGRPGKTLDKPGYNEYIAEPATGQIETAEYLPEWIAGYE